MSWYDAISLSLSVDSALIFSTSSVVSVGSVYFSWKFLNFKASFEFSWVSLEDFPSEKKEPIK
ncbi:hypothetical protein ACQJ5A_00465 [Helicobacter pylori]